MGDFPDWQKVVKCTNHSAELLQQRTSDAASNALTIITEALSISSYSEKLLKMKGEALCMVCLIKFLHVFLSFSLLISSLPFTFLLLFKIGSHYWLFSFGIL